MLFCFALLHTFSRTMHRFSKGAPHNSLTLSAPTFVDIIGIKVHWYILYALLLCSFVTLLLCYCFFERHKQIWGLWMEKQHQQSGLVHVGFVSKQALFLSKLTYIYVSRIQPHQTTRIPSHNSRYIPLQYIHLYSPITITVVRYNIK